MAAVRATTLGIVLLFAGAFTGVGGLAAAAAALPESVLWTLTGAACGTALAGLAVFAGYTRA